MPANESIQGYEEVATTRSESRLERGWQTSQTVRPLQCVR